MGPKGEGTQGGQLLQEPVEFPEARRSLVAKQKPLETEVNSGRHSSGRQYS